MLALTMFIASISVPATDNLEGGPNQLVPLRGYDVIVDHHVSIEAKIVVRIEALKLIRHNSVTTTELHDAVRRMEKSLKSLNSKQELRVQVSVRFVNGAYNVRIHVKVFEELLATVQGVCEPNCRSCCS